MIKDSEQLNSLLTQYHNKILVDKSFITSLSRNYSNNNNNNKINNINNNKNIINSSSIIDQQRTDIAKRFIDDCKQYFISQMITECNNKLVNDQMKVWGQDLQEAKAAADAAALNEQFLKAPDVPIKSIIKDSVNKQVNNKFKQSAGAHNKNHNNYNKRKANNNYNVNNKRAKNNPVNVVSSSSSASNDSKNEKAPSIHPHTIKKKVHYNHYNPHQQGKDKEREKNNSTRVVQNNQH